MIYFGDARRRVDTRAALREVHARWGRASRSAEPLLDVLLRLGEVVQGVLDDDLERLGAEPPSWERRRRRVGLHALACHYVGLLRGRRTSACSARTLAELVALELPESVQVKVVEGFAHYAVLPELYAKVAAEIREPRVRVLGIRSAGVVLGAVVAASAEAPGTHSARPEGHPFARVINASPALRAEIAADAGATWLVVDEGPGLSGSSFLAAADLLEAQGVASDRVRLMPSHAGSPGAAASDDARRRFAAYARSCACFEQYHSAAALPFRARPNHLRWTEGAFMDLSGGRWRDLCFGRDREPPPALRAQERRKYWFVEAGNPKLAKFAGLGEHGQRKLRRGRLLAAHGFIPKPERLRAGFLISEWLEGEPADVLRRDRAQCLGFLRAYLALLSARSAAASDRGACPSALLSMAETNVRLCLGSEHAARVGGFGGLARSLDQRLRPVYTDGKLEPWEFIVVAGRLVKTDALDHAAGHDLVRAQPIAWDVAGASVELELSDEDALELGGSVTGQREQRIDAGVLAFYRICYLAFKIGGLSLGQTQESDPVELSRLAARRSYYETGLRALLERAQPP